MPESTWAEQYHKAEVCFCGNPHSDTKTIAVYGVTCHVSLTAQRGVAMSGAVPVPLWALSHLSHSYSSRNRGVLCDETCSLKIHRISCGCGNQGYPWLTGWRPRLLSNIDLKTQSDIILTTAILAHIIIYLLQIYWNSCRQMEHLVRMLFHN